MLILTQKDIVKSQVKFHILLLLVNQQPHEDELVACGLNATLLESKLVA